MIFILNPIAPRLGPCRSAPVAGAAKRDAGDRIGRAVAAGTMLLAVLAACFARVGSARADDVEAFYRGATINLMIGSSAGGGYDLYARLMARHLGRHIPGRPVIVPKNIPAASGVAAMRHVYDVAPRDGLTIGTTLRNTFFDPLMYPEQKRTV